MDDPATFFWGLMFGAIGIEGSDRIGQRLVVTAMAFVFVAVAQDVLMGLTENIFP